MLSAGKRKKLYGLLKKYALGTATPEEIAFIEAYYRHFDGQPSVVDDLSEQDNADTHARLLEKINYRIAESEKTRSISVWKRIAVAATLVLLAGSAYLYFNNRPKHEATTITALKNDIPPGDNRAILTLADGKQIILDSARNGTLAQQ